MDLTTDGFAMFLHIGLVIVGMSMAAVLHAALLMLRAADDVRVIRMWPPVIATLERVLPATALGILLTGAWLLDLNSEEFTWGQGWVVTSIVALVAAESVGGLLGPRSSALRAAIHDAPDGPIAGELRSRILDRALWCGLHFTTGVFLSVVFVMAAKPTALGSALVVAVVSLLAAASGLPFTRPRTAPVAIPTQPRVVDVTEPSEQRTAQR